MNGHGRPGSSGRVGDGGSDGNGGRGMPHINDLRAEAKSGYGMNTPLATLLDLAAKSQKQALFMLELRRPDKAYVEYLRASEIVIEVIPRHKDKPAIERNRGRLEVAYQNLLKDIDSQHEQFSKIKDIIVNDNKRNQVQPRYVPQSPVGDRRPSTPNDRLAEIRYDGSRVGSPEAITNGRTSSRPGSSGTPFEYTNGRSSPAYQSASPKKKPPINPKPESLHGKALQADARAPRTNADPLMERFANLRNPSSSHYGASGRSTQPLPRPIGPREQPPSSSSGISRPDKLPLQMQIPMGLPKQPSPTYSPARNLSTPPSIEPPRTSARSIVGTGGRSNSLQASMSSQYSTASSEETQSQFMAAPQTYARSSSRNPRRKSVHVPERSQISAEKLYDYIRLYDILLIDVRPREDFDEGHIFAKSIMCIEPTALRREMSGDELNDSLVLSPDPEQGMFDERDQFDLVVCYDQSTPSTVFLDKRDRTPGEDALKNLFDALFEFNQDKPLQHHPLMLKGGLDAWADLLGSNALATSNTAVLAAKGKKTSLRRSSGVSDSRHHEHRRRRREFNPLDPEEEKRWMDKDHHEAVEPEVRTSIDEDDEGAPEETTRHYTGYEDFLRRFPEPEMLEQQSMVSPPTRSPPPPPAYSAPPIPQVPSRPPPAVPRPGYSGVHEHHSGPQNQLSRSATLDAYIPHSMQPQNVRLPRTGLINFGVTCYMNATLQCLSGTLPLSRVFMNDYWQPLVQRENWKGTRGVMPQYFADVVRALWKGDVNAIRPVNFRALSARLNREWGNERQQDAKEFFDFLVDFMHEDFNSNWARPPLPVLSNAEEAERERLPKPYAASIEWGRYSHREKSLVTDLFAGQHASRLRCTTCGFTSTTYEAFYSLSVEIPHSKGIVSLDDCLKSYCNEERLSGDEVWRCPRCKKEREATKQITLTRAPRYLVIHLKRFSAGHSETARKVRTPVDFPLRDLDIGPYMLPPLAPSESESIARQQRGSGAMEQIEQIKKDPATNAPYIYDAYAVMRHLGTTISSGHYIAMVNDKARNIWRQFDDNRVSDFKPGDMGKGDRLQNEMAYILFYERVGSTKGSL